MNKRKYSKDLATLIALISNLALGKYSKRSVKGLSRDTSIDEKEIEAVLKNYKSLFRKSSKLEKYSLHIRHALQYEVNEDEKKVKPPLDSTYITSLINFVTDNAKEDTKWNLAMIASTVSLIVAFLAFFK